VGTASISAGSRDATGSETGKGTGSAAGKVTVSGAVTASASGNATCSDARSMTESGARNSSESALGNTTVSTCVVSSSTVGFSGAVSTFSRPELFELLDERELFDEKLFLNKDFNFIF